ncbi:MAG: TMEM175 family protein [Pseudomonadota bacterium]
MTDSNHSAGRSPHRLEALTDGIFAVAMTLLVIELKFPEHADTHSAAELAGAVWGLIPKFFSWLISFMVLALFWVAHHRIFSHVRQVTGPLVGLNIFQLALVSFMPFCSALIGENGGAVIAQIFYSANMVLLALFSMLLARYVHRHPELCSAPMSRGAYRGAQVRNTALIVISFIAVGIGFFTMPAIGNIAYVLMAIVMPLSRRFEKHSGR